MHLRLESGLIYNANARNSKKLTIRTLAFKLQCNSARGSVLLEKLEVGVLAFETDQGLVYAQPSVWQRLYLLWTFRNFRSLPVKLLNSRQLRLVESLERCDLISLEPDPEKVIGTVEGARVSHINVSKATRVADSRSPSGSNLHIRTSIVDGKKEIPEDRAVERGPRALQENTKSSPGLTSGWNLVAGAVFVLIAIFASRGLPWSQVWDTIASEKVVAQVLGRTFAGNSPSVSTNVKETVATTGNVVTNDAEVSLPAPTPVAEPASQTVSPAQITTSDVQLTIPPVNETSTESTPVDTMQAHKSLPDETDASRMIASIHQLAVNEATSRILVSRPPLKLIYPGYPGIRGKVEMKAIIDADGRVEAVKILSGSRILSAAAAGAVRKWHYDPYLKDGEAVATETNVRILFVAADVISISFPESLSAAE